MDYKQMEDSALVRRYIGGEEAALQTLISRHQSRIFAYIISKIQDEDLANDVFQDTFVKVIRTLRRGKYQEEGKFLQWAMRIAHNLVIDHFRRAKRMPTVSPTEEFNIFAVIQDQQPSAEKALIQGQIEQDLHRLIAELPEEQRRVLELRHFGGLSFKDIAEQTGVSINTALGRMRYALINLRKLMEKHRVSLKVD